MRISGSKTERNRGRVSNRIAENISKHITETLPFPSESVFMLKGREISFSGALEPNSSLHKMIPKSRTLGGQKERIIRRGSSADRQEDPHGKENWPWENDTYLKKKRTKIPIEKAFFRERSNHDRGGQRKCKVEDQRKEYGQVNLDENRLYTKKPNRHRDSNNFNEEYDDIPKGSGQGRRVPTFRAKRANGSQEVRNWKQRMGSGRMMLDSGSDAESLMMSNISYNKRPKRGIPFSLSSVKGKAMRNRRTAKQEGYYVRLESASDLRPSIDEYAKPHTARDLGSRTTDYTQSKNSTKKGFFKDCGKEKLEEWEMSPDRPKNTVSKYHSHKGIKEMILQSQGQIPIYAAEIESKNLKSFQKDTGQIENIRVKKLMRKHNTNKKTQNPKSHIQKQRPRNQQKTNKSIKNPGQNQTKSRERRSKKDRGNVDSNPARAVNTSNVDPPTRGVDLFLEEVKEMMKKKNDSGSVIIKKERHIHLRESSILRKRKREKSGGRAKVDLHFNKDKKYNKIRTNVRVHSTLRSKDPSILEFSQEPGQMTGYLVSPKQNHSQHQNPLYNNNINPNLQNQSTQGYEYQNKNQAKHPRRKKISEELGRVIDAVSEENFGYSRRNIHSDNEDVFYLTKNVDNSLLSRHNKFVKKPRAPKPESNISINYKSRDERGAKRLVRGNSLAVKRPEVIGRLRESRSLGRRRPRPDGSSTQLDHESEETRAKRGRNRSPMRASSQLKFGDETLSRRKKDPAIQRKITNERPHGDMVKRSIDLLDHNKSAALHVSLTESFLRKKEISGVSLDYRGTVEEFRKLEERLKMEKNERAYVEEELERAKDRVQEMESDLRKTRNENKKETDLSEEMENLKRKMSDLKEDLAAERRDNEIKNDRIMDLENELKEEKSSKVQIRKENKEKEKLLQQSQLEMVENMNQRNKYTAQLEARVKSQEKQILESRREVESLKAELGRKVKIKGELEETRLEGVKSREEIQIVKREREEARRHHEESQRQNTKLASELELLATENRRMGTLLEKNKHDLQMWETENGKMKQYIGDQTTKIGSLEQIVKKSHTEKWKHEEAHKIYICNSCKTNLDILKKQNQQPKIKNQRIFETRNQNNYQKPQNETKPEYIEPLLVRKKEPIKIFKNNRVIEPTQTEQIRHNITRPVTPPRNNNKYINTRPASPQPKQIWENNHQSPANPKHSQANHERQQTPVRKIRRSLTDTGILRYSSASKPQLARVFVNNKLVYDKNSNFEDKEVSQDISLFESERKPKRRFQLDGKSVRKISLRNMTQMRASNDQELGRNNRFMSGDNSASVTFQNLGYRGVSPSPGTGYHKTGHQRNFSLQVKQSGRVEQESTPKVITNRNYHRVEKQHESGLIQGPYHVQNRSKPNDNLGKQQPELSQNVKSHSSEPLSGYRRVIKRTQRVSKENESSRHHASPHPNKNLQSHKISNLTSNSRLNHPNQKQPGQQISNSQYQNQNQGHRQSSQNERVSEYYYIRSNQELQNQPNPTDQTQKPPQNTNQNKQLPPAKDISKVDDLLERIKYNIENNNIQAQSSSDERYLVSNLQSTTNQNGTSVEEFSKTYNQDPGSIQIFNLQTAPHGANGRDVNTQITISEQYPYHVKGQQNGHKSESSKTLYNKDRNSNYAGNTLYSINSGKSGGSSGPGFGEYSQHSKMEKGFGGKGKPSKTNLRCSGSQQRITQRKQLKGFIKTESGFLDESLQNNDFIEADFNEFKNQLRNNHEQIQTLKLKEKRDSQIKDRKVKVTQNSFEDKGIFKLFESKRSY